MMESDLVAFLLSQSSLQALIASRLYPVIIPEALSQFPCVTYQVVSSVPEYTNDGPTGLTVARVQFDVWGQAYGDCKAVASALQQLLDGYAPGPMGSTFISAIWMTNRATDSFDQDARLYRSSADYRIAYAG